MPDFEDRLRRQLREYATSHAPIVDAEQVAAAAVSRPRRSWSWLAATAAIVIAIGVTTAGVRTLTNHGDASPPPSAPVRSGSPTPEATPTRAPAVVPTTLDLTDIAFVRAVSPALDRPADPIRLEVGTLDGNIRRTAELPSISRLSFPTFGALNPAAFAGPVRGKVVYMVEKGDEAELHLVDASSGIDRLILTTTSVIWNLAIAPDASRAFLLEVDRSSAAFAGVDSVSLTDPSDERTVIEPGALSAATGSIDLVVAAPFWAQLLADDTHVVALVCRDQQCLAPIADLATGAVVVSGEMEFGETLVGLTPDAAIGSSKFTCGREVCDGFRIGLTDGRRTPLGGEQPLDPIVVVDTAAGAVALTDVSDDQTGTYEVLAMNLVSGIQSAVATATYDVGSNYLRLISPVSTLLSAELPPGWALLSSNADGAPAPPPDISAVSVDGKRVPLPVLSPSGAD